MLNFIDNFQYYGIGATGKANMLLGAPWLEANSVGPDLTNPVPGTLHAYRFGATVGGLPAMRWGLKQNTSIFGVAIRIYISSLPSANDVFYLWQVRDATNAPQCTVTVTNTGILQLRNGDVTGTVLASTAAPALAAGAWTHFEARFNIADSGACEIRRNGSDIVLNATAVDTKATANVGASSVATRILGGETFIADAGDLQEWDALGGINDTFLGDCSVLWRGVLADDTLTDWVRNTGATDVSCIDDIEQDGDATYIGSSTPGAVSEFTFDDVPANTSEVIGVVIRPCWKKNTAGTATVRTGLRSGASVANGVTVAPGTTYAFDVGQAFQVDPATGARFTPAGINAALLRVEKVA